jgi:hypothetical protein
MEKVRFHTSNDLHLNDEPVPTPAAGEALICVKDAGT